LGSGAGSNLTTGNNNIDIGNQGVAGEGNTIRIGGDTGFGPQTNTYIAGISGATVASGVTVIVGSDGHLGTMVSSTRFKDEIKPLDKASEGILALKPVTFRYKKEVDPQRISQFGLVAEEVEKVNPDLVVRDAHGEIYTVRYEAVNAMLLNEFLKEHRKAEDRDCKIQQQEATIADLGSAIAQQRRDFETTVAQQQNDFQATVARLTARVDEQGSKIQRVSAQIEASKPAPQVVLNNP
jgi:hypothetical protein